MNDVIQIEDKTIAQTFSRLEKALKGDLVMKALLKGAEELQAETRSMLRQELGAGATSTVKRKHPMERGVTLVEDAEMEEVRVSLYGDFRLKWFEMGTAERMTKHKGAKARKRAKMYRPGANRGRIQALNFFEKARSDENRLIGIINSTLTREIENLLK